ncbi:hypothetical protein [Dactylosporangium salmoneum]|uniref:Abortive infection protein-like C-terminal domain-containing protein n=1 Tax=Dactylosporangium salmoneum TaxID=53361 RepID=A0ABN3GIF2_9ACTN
MRPDDFFDDQPNTGGIWPSGPTRTFNVDLVEELRRAPVADRVDVDVAVGLVRLVHDDLERVGTGVDPELTELQIRMAILTLHAVLKRLTVSFDMPFRDFATFRAYWKRNGAGGKYQARRDILNELFNPLLDQLVELQAQGETSTLADAVSPRRVTGWARVDAEIGELRRHFQNAQTVQDYRNIGNDAVTVLETLSATAYDPAVHLRAGEIEPPVAQTKLRLDRVIEDALPGASNAHLRKLARASIEFAQQVKHTPTGNRRDAGVAADAVILLANILRRLTEPIAPTAATTEEIAA